MASLQFLWLQVYQAPLAQQPRRSDLLRAFASLLLAPRIDPHFPWRSDSAVVMSTYDIGYPFDRLIGRMCTSQFSMDFLETPLSIVCDVLEVDQCIVMDSSKVSAERVYKALEV